MQTAFKKVARFFFYIMVEFFITNSYNIIFKTIQQPIAVDEKTLLYIRRKIVTSKREAPVPPHFEGSMEQEKL